MRYSIFKIVLFSIFIGTNSLEPMHYVRSLQTQIPNNQYAHILLAIPFLCIQKIAYTKALKELDFIKKFSYTFQEVETLEERINQIEISPNLRALITAYKNDFRHSAELQSVSRKINENAIDHNLLIKQETLRKEQEEIQETILKVTGQLCNSPQPNQADLQNYLQAREQLKKAHTEHDEQLLKYFRSSFVMIGALIGYGVAEFCIAQFLKQPTHYLEMSTTWKHWVTQKAIFFIVPLMVSQCVNAAFKFQQNFPQSHNLAIQIILSSIASYVAQIRLNNYFYIEIVPFTTEEHVLTCVGQYVLPGLCSVFAVQYFDPTPSPENIEPKPAEEANSAVSAEAERPAV